MEQTKGKIMLLIVLGTMVTAMVIGVSIQSNEGKAGKAAQPESITTEHFQSGC